MQLITSPISREEPVDSRIAVVTNLQTCLLLLLRRGAIPGGIEGQAAFEEGLQREQRNQVYGDITQRLARSPDLVWCVSGQRNTPNNRKNNQTRRKSGFTDWRIGKIKKLRD